MKEYWYLREGDFRPERIEVMCKNWHRSRRSIVEFLSENGNIFTSKAEAEAASAFIRSSLIGFQPWKRRIAEIHIAFDCSTPDIDYSVHKIIED